VGACQAIPPLPSVIHTVNAHGHRGGEGEGVIETLEGDRLCHPRGTWMFLDQKPPQMQLREEALTLAENSDRGGRGEGEGGREGEGGQIAYVHSHSSKTRAEALAQIADGDGGERGNNNGKNVV